MRNARVRIIMDLPDGRSMEKAFEFTPEQYQESIRVGDMSRPVATFGDDVIRAIEERNTRRHALRRVVDALGTALVDFIEDMEGWNGTERQAKTKEGIRRG